MDLLHSRAPLQVLFDLCRVFSVEPLSLFVELGVPLVDVVDVCVVVVGPASAVLGPLIDPTITNKRQIGDTIGNNDELRPRITFFIVV